jgi:hypothetical protein
MDTIRDITNTLTPTFFSYLIVIDILLGSIWAVKRLYADYTNRDDTPLERPQIKLGKD